MRTKHPQYNILGFLLIASFSLSMAQMKTSVAMFSSYDDNAFRNSSNQADYITTASFSLEYQPEESNLNFFLNGNANFFKEYSERKYAAGSLGFSYTKPFGDDEENALYAGGNYFTRFNKEQFNYYDFNQVLGYLNAKYYFDYESGIMSRAGYRFRYRSYKNLDQFSYTEHYLFAQLSKFFESKTTIITEVDLGNKNYATPSPMSSSSSTMQSSSGHGGMGSSGGMMGSPGNTGMGQPASIVTYADPSTTQLAGILRIAQSITTSTGLSVQYLRRWDMSSHSRFMSNGAVDYRGEEELWDDPYGYQSNEYNATLTQELPWNITVRVAVEYLIKDYTRNIYLNSDINTPTGPLRADTRSIGGIELKKSFDDTFWLFDGLTASVSYYYQRNVSNDPYYNYRNNSLVVGISTDL